MSTTSIQQQADDVGDDPVGERRDEGMHEPVEDRRHHRAFQAAEPADDGDDEGGDDHRMTHVRPGAHQRRGEGARDAGHGCGDAHGEAGGPVDRDALQGRRLRVLSAGPERPPEPGAAHGTPTARRARRPRRRSRRGAGGRRPRRRGRRDGTSHGSAARCAPCAPRSPSRSPPGVSATVRWRRSALPGDCPGPAGNSVRSIAIPSPPTKTSPSITARK